MKITIKELVVFALLGALMFVGDVGLEFLPNIHLVGVLLMAYTVVYRAKALYPLIVYVFVTGLFSGFAFWWMPYLYIWPVLWGITMLLPRRMPLAVATVVYMAVCGLHGLAFGILYAPAQVLLFHLPWKSVSAWIAAGLPFDLIHAVGNLCLGILIVPLVRLLQRVERMAR